MCAVAAASGDFGLCLADFGGALPGVFDEQVRHLGRMRTTDRFARYGGEEFVMLMPATTQADSAGVAVERIRQAAETKDWNPILPGHGVTLSAGVATYRGDESIEELLARADAALYEAKHNGRNQFVVRA